MNALRSDAKYLSQTDAIMWMVEKDPLLRSTILGIAILDSPPDWLQLQARVEHVIDQVPSLRHRVQAMPLHRSTLRWAVDSDFDLARHVHRVELAEPGGLSDVLEFARKSASEGFDRSRPLWNFTIIEGLAKGQAAFVMKVHHVLTDGVGSVQLAAYLFDFESPSKTVSTTSRVMPGSAREVRAAEAHDPLGLFRDVVEHDVDGIIDFARRSAPSVLRNLVRALRHPREVLTETIELARSIGRTVAPVTSTMSSIMAGRDTTSEFRVMDVSLKHLHDAAKAAGGTVNDGFLAGITGGLRRYHERHGAVADELRVAMPISLRVQDDVPGGNHVTVMRFKVPVGTANPTERIGALHQIAKEIRSERSLEYTGAIAGALNLLPTQVIGSMLKRVDFLASNVPGVPIPMYLLGSKVTHFYPFGPTAGSAVNITLMSYRNRCYLGVNIDTTAIPDPDIFMRCLKAGFAEVLRLESAESATA